MIKKYLIFSLLLALMVGCVPTTLFYWGDYSSTLYAYKKDPNNNTIAAHKKSLSEIIYVSGRNGKKVPPGIYAEFGYMLIKEGKEKEGMEYLEKEMTSYPESEVLIKHLKDELARGQK
jgi:hypothetical protein